MCWFSRARDSVLSLQILNAEEYMKKLGSGEYSIGVMKPNSFTILKQYNSYTLHAMCNIVMHTIYIGRQ